MYERQRVWRACQACRRKKVKCDGEHPCQSCTRNGAECVFEQFSNMKLVDPQYVKKLENRLAQMEKELKQRQLSAESRVSIDLSAQSSNVTASYQGSSQPIQSAVSDPTDEFLAPFSAATPASESQARENCINVPDAPIFDNHDSQHGEVAILPESTAIDVTRLEEPIIERLIDVFYHSIYPIFPIVHHRNLRSQYENWLSVRADGRHENDGDFSALLYALLAVAASVTPKNHAVFDQQGLEIYKEVDLGELLYSHAAFLATRAYRGSARFPMNIVISQGLLSLYLTEGGRVNDAWVTAGHAIRLYQGLDLEEITDTWHEHSKLWWCLYILDRSLSTALLKPLAIDDADSDIESYTEHEPPTDAKTDPWFSVIADFHVTMGRIYRSVRRIRKSNPSQTAKLRDTLRSHVKKHDAELERYYRKQVLPKIKEPHHQIGPLALQTIAISSYYIGVVLLYRTFIERLNIAEPAAFLRCAEAASSCIKLTPQVIATVPASHFVIQQSRAIYASVNVLLHCMRLARNPSFTNKAWSNVESGFNMLRNLKIKWPEIKKYQNLTEEDMRFTQCELAKYDLFYHTFGRYGQGTGTQRQGDISPTSTASPVLSLEDQGCSDLRNVHPEATREPQETESTLTRDGESSERQSKRRKVTPDSFFPCDPTALFDLLPTSEESQEAEPQDMVMHNDLSESQSLFLGDFSAEFFDDSMLLSSIEQFLSYPSE
ncbi:Transcription factor [Penicillium odoratum]|uniref:Transcription factor n=1 Tax=Penicillium odoratum TaxID=1167516 RepID=UPI002547CFE5|nr:Transcription factor [Penicillium odoratum]KAJ5760498.1 Transcription factor [Penicillium odoratum]